MHQTSESDSDDFDHGALIDRNDQRGQLLQKVYQTQHKRGLKCHTNLCKIFGGNTHKIRGIKPIITVRAGKVPESFHRSPFSVVAALPAQQMAKRSRPFTDEASKYTGEPKQVCKRVLALVAVRYEKSSPLISAEEETQSDVKSQINSSHASKDRLQFPSSSRNPGVTEPEASNTKVLIGCPKKNSRMHHRHRDAMSPIIPGRDKYVVNASSLFRTW